MAFNELLANHVRNLISSKKNLIEKKMFGGLSFLINGNMAVGVIGDELIVRAAPEKSEALLKQKHTRVFDFTGKVMKGWLVVTEKGCQSVDALKPWIKIGTEFAESLPIKK